MTSTDTESELEQVLNIPVSKKAKLSECAEEADIKPRIPFDPTFKSNKVISISTDEDDDKVVLQRNLFKSKVSVPYEEALVINSSDEESI